MYPAAAEGSKLNDDVVPWTENENQRTCACSAAVQRGGSSLKSTQEDMGDHLPAVWLYILSTLERRRRGFVTNVCRELPSHLLLISVWKGFRPKGSGLWKSYMNRKNLYGVRKQNVESYRIQKSYIIRKAPQYKFKNCTKSLFIGFDFSHQTL